MSIHDRDYVMRMIRRMVEMLGRALGLAKVSPEEARKTIDATGQALFGPLYATLRRVDAKTAASLLGDPEKRWALAALLLEESRLAEGAGAPKRAQADLRAAAEILLDLAAGREGLSAHGEETLREVAERLDATRLSEERRGELARALGRGAEESAGGAHRE